MIRRGQRFGHACLTACVTASATILVVATTGATGGVASPARAVTRVEALRLHSARQPGPLHGVPIRGVTGLRLVFADIPPQVLDVGSGRVRPLAGVPAVRRGVLWIVGVGGATAVVLAQTAWPRAHIYAVRDRGARASSLGIGSSVWPANDSRTVWIQSIVDRSRCTLRRVGLDGRQLRAPRAFPCATRSDPAGGSLGLVVHNTRVLDPLTRRTVLKTRWGILAVAGQHVVLAGPGRQFTLLNAATGAEQRLPWPSILSGRDEPAVDPRGRFVALTFGDPAWRGGSQQALDVWLLETKTRKLTQLPSMPAFVALKSTSIAWTHDGPLVLLAEQLSGRDVVAVWRPGQRRLALKTVHLPNRSDSGSDSFAPLQ
jgi:hypothetical protein